MAKVLPVHAFVAIYVGTYIGRACSVSKTAHSKYVLYVGNINVINNPAYPDTVFWKKITSGFEPTIFCFFTMS
jgi:hypothetical protein